jgi:protein-S-isoprenylcysteine O-methyltransferase Ste14
MTGVASPGERPSAARGLAGPWRVALTGWNLAVFAVWLVLPFVLARSATWPAGWLHLGVIAAGGIAERRFVARRNPGLKARRRRIGTGTKTWDLAWNVAYWPLMASIALVGGLQHGTGGGSLPAWVWPAGLVVVASGFGLSAWAMGTNPFFEGTVRIQAEVEHRVYEGGPYRYLRHPGYLGLVLWALGTPLLLRSGWSAGVALAASAWVVLRTALEDATLARELPGYQDYSRRTRFRLVPGIW